MASFNLCLAIATMVFVFSFIGGESLQTPAKKCPNMKCICRAEELEKPEPYWNENEEDLLRQHRQVLDQLLANLRRDLNGENGANDDMRDMGKLKKETNMEKYRNIESKDLKSLQGNAQCHQRDQVVGSRNSQTLENAYYTQRVNGGINRKSNDLSYKGPQGKITHKGNNGAHFLHQKEGWVSDKINDGNFGFPQNVEHVLNLDKSYNCNKGYNSDDGDALRDSQYSNYDNADDNESLNENALRDSQCDNKNIYANTKSLKHPLEDFHYSDSPNSKTSKDSPPDGNRNESKKSNKHYWENSQQSDTKSVTPNKKTLEADQDDDHTTNSRKLNKQPLRVSYDSETNSRSSKKNNSEEAYEDGNERGKFNKPTLENSLLTDNNSGTPKKVYPADSSNESKSNGNRKSIKHPVKNSPYEDSNQHFLFKENKFKDKTFYNSGDRTSNCQQIGNTPENTNPQSYEDHHIRYLTNAENEKPAQLMKTWTPSMKGAHHEKGKSMSFANTEIDGDNNTVVNSRETKLDQGSLNPHPLNHFSNILNYEDNISLLNDQMELTPNTLSHEANYKLSKVEQEAAVAGEKNNSTFWKWPPWGSMKRAVPFNAMNEIKLKTSCRLMKQGLGPLLPSYALSENHQDTMIDNRVEFKEKEFLTRDDRNSKAVDDDLADEERSEQNGNIFESGDTMIDNRVALKEKEFLTRDDRNSKAVEDDLSDEERSEENGNIFESGEIERSLKSPNFDLQNPIHYRQKRETAYARDLHKLECGKDISGKVMKFLNKHDGAEENVKQGETESPSFDLQNPIHHRQKRETAYARDLHKLECGKDTSGKDMQFLNKNDGAEKNGKQGEIESPNFDLQNPIHQRQKGEAVYTRGPYNEHNYYDIFKDNRGEDMELFNNNERARENGKQGVINSTGLKNPIHHREKKETAYPRDHHKVQYGNICKDNRGEDMKFFNNNDGAEENGKQREIKSSLKPSDFVIKNPIHHRRKRETIYSRDFNKVPYGNIFKAIRGEDMQYFNNYQEVEENRIKGEIESPDFHLQNPTHHGQTRETAFPKDLHKVQYSNIFKDNRRGDIEFFKNDGAGEENERQGENESPLKSSNFELQNPTHHRQKRETVYPRDPYEEQYYNIFKDNRGEDMQFLNNNKGAKENGKKGEIQSPYFDLQNPIHHQQKRETAYPRDPYRVQYYNIFPENRGEDNKFLNNKEEAEENGKPGRSPKMPYNKSPNKQVLENENKKFRGNQSFSSKANEQTHYPQNQEHKDLLLNYNSRNLKKYTTSTSLNSKDYPTSLDTSELNRNKVMRKSHTSKETHKKPLENPKPQQTKVFKDHDLYAVNNSPYYKSQRNPNHFYEHYPNLRHELEALEEGMQQNQTMDRISSNLPKSDSTNNETNNENHKISLEFGNAMPNCTTFRELEEFLKSVTKPESETTSKPEEPEDMEEVEIDFTTLDIPEQVTTEENETESEVSTTTDNNLELSTPETPETSTIECEDTHDKWFTEVEDQISEAQTTPREFDPKMTEISTTLPKDIVDSPIEKDNDQNMKLNITINANVQGNSKDKSYFGNASIHVKPGYLDDRFRRQLHFPIYQEKLDKGRCLHCSEKQPSPTNEDKDDPLNLTSGKLSSDIVKAVFRTVRNSPELKILWPSLKRNRILEKPQLANFYSLRNKDNDKQIQKSEELFSEAMGALNDIIDQQIYTRSCLPLRPDLRDFYNLILRSNEEQERKRVKREKAQRKLKSSTKAKLKRNQGL